MDHCVRVHYHMCINGRKFSDPLPEQRLHRPGSLIDGILVSEVGEVGVYLNYPVWLYEDNCGYITHGHFSWQEWLDFHPRNDVMEVPRDY